MTLETKVTDITKMSYYVVLNWSVDICDYIPPHSPILSSTDPILLFFFLSNSVVSFMCIWRSVEGGMVVGGRQFKTWLWSGNTQSPTADQPTVPWGRATEHLQSQYIRKAIKIKQPATKTNNVLYEWDGCSRKIQRYRQIMKARKPNALLFDPEGFRDSPPPPPPPPTTRL